MSLENIDPNTSIEKDLGGIPTRFGDTLFCKFRYSPKEGGSFDMIFVPHGRGAARSCSFQLNSFKQFIEVLKEAGNLFGEADALIQKQSAEAKAVDEEIRRLTQ